MTSILRVAEFYSGIGGMHYALQKANIDSQVVRAFDINTVANEVYKHNFPDVPVMQRAIEVLPLEMFEKMRADLWTMSPPCQPYTRQGLKKGSQDERAKSFLFIIDLLGKLVHKPKHLLMENVAGFEKSDTRTMFLCQLAKVGYRLEEYLLNPLQLCVPNSRTRYYLVAKLTESANALEKKNDFLPHFRHSVPGAHLIQPAADAEGNVDFERGVWHHNEVHQVKEYLELSPDAAPEILHPYRLKPQTLEKYGWVSDVVTAEDRRTTCFTKSYSQYAEGTGSILQLEGQVGKDKMTAENTRYFSPREVANLMGFPVHFSFPETTTNKQGYRLLGNSLSVDVVAVLVDYLVNRM